MIQNPYESPRGTSNDELDRLPLARRIIRFLVLAGILVVLYFIYKTLDDQLFFLSRPKSLRDLMK